MAVGPANVLRWCRASKTVPSYAVCSHTVLPVFVSSASTFSTCFLSPATDCGMRLLDPDRLRNVPGDDFPFERGGQEDPVSPHDRRRIPVRQFHFPRDVLRPESTPWAAVSPSRNALPARATPLGPVLGCDAGRVSEAEADREAHTKGTLHQRTPVNRRSVAAVFESRNDYRQPVLAARRTRDERLVVADERCARRDGPSRATAHDEKASKPGDILRSLCNTDLSLPFVCGSPLR